MARYHKNWGRSRKNNLGQYLRGSVNENVVLTTLAATTVVASQFEETVNEKTFISSLVAKWSLANFTKAVNDGPIKVGVAHSDYTITEIEEWIENTGSWNQGDLVNSREIGKRLIREIGVFEAPVDAAAIVVLNDGKPIHTKLKWLLLQGQTLDLWAYNMGSSALATTAPIVACEGHANLWPK